MIAPAIALLLKSESLQPTWPWGRASRGQEQWGFVAKELGSCPGHVHYPRSCQPRCVTSWCLLSSDINLSKPSPSHLFPSSPLFPSLSICGRREAPRGTYGIEARVWPWAPWNQTAQGESSLPLKLCSWNWPTGSRLRAWVCESQAFPSPLAHVHCPWCFSLSLKNILSICMYVGAHVHTCYLYTRMCSISLY